MNNFLEILFRCDKLVEEAWRNRVSLLTGHSVDREELGFDRIYLIVWNIELRKPVLALLDTNVHPSPPLFIILLFDSHINSCIEDSAGHAHLTYIS